MIGVIIVAIMTIAIGIFFMHEGISNLREDIRDKADIEFVIFSVLLSITGLVLFCIGIGLFFCK